MAIRSLKLGLIASVAVVTVIGVARYRAQPPASQPPGDEGERAAAAQLDLEAIRTAGF